MAFTLVEGRGQRRAQKDNHAISASLIPMGTLENYIYHGGEIGISPIGENIISGMRQGEGGYHKDVTITSELLRFAKRRK